MTNAIQSGLKRASTQWQLAALVYAINVVFALGLAIAFKDVLSDEFATRNVSSRLIEGFDFTFLSDLNYASASLSSLFEMWNWTMIGYALLSVFLSGGMIASLQRQAFSVPDFFADSARYFGRFIMLLMFFALTVLVPLLAFAIFFTIGKAHSESALSEVPVVLWTVAGIGIAAIKLAFFYLVFEVAKFEIVRENIKPFRAFIGAFKIVLKNFLVLFGITLFFLLCVGVIGLVLHGLAPKGETGASVFVLVLMQQVLVASRVFFRVATVGALLEKYQVFKAVMNEKKLAEESKSNEQLIADAMNNNAEIKPIDAEQTEQSQSEVQTPSMPGANEANAVRNPNESQP